MGKLHVSLLGSLAVQSDSGRPVGLANKKAKGLLAYLALAPARCHSRDKLAALLWADSDPERARNSLRQTLCRLRQQLPSTDVEVVVARQDELSLSVDHVVGDALAFERLVRAGTVEALERAVALYQGDFLDGLTFAEDGFEEWLVGERWRLKELAVGALARLLAHHVASGPIERAVETATRLMALDPLAEAAHRGLMTLYARQGRTGAALRQYDACVAALRREIGVEPEAATTALYHAIRGARRHAQAALRPPSPATVDTAVVGPSATAFAPVRARWTRSWRRAAVATGAVLVLATAVAGAWLVGATPPPFEADLVASDPGRARPGDSDNGRAYQAYQRASRLLWQRERTDRLDINRARTWLTKAIALDPGYAAAYARLGDSYWLEAHNPAWAAGPHEMKRARELAWKAIDLGNSPLAYRLLAKIHLFPIWDEQRNYERAIAAARTAVSLDPEDPDGLADLAEVLVYAGQPIEALELIERAKRQHVIAPDWYYRVAGYGYLLAGHYERAADEFLTFYQRRKGFGCLRTSLLLAASLAKADKLDAASQVLAAFLARRPAATVEGVAAHFETLRRPRDRTVILEGLAVAGLPERAESL